MIKGVTQVHLGPIWYYSEPSYIPYFPNQFLGWDFWRFLRQDGSSTETSLILKFVFSKKATKINEIFTINLTVCSKCQIDGEDFVKYCGLLGKHELYLV